jgi:hypothetical protein
MRRANADCCRLDSRGSSARRVPILPMRIALLSSGGGQLHRTACDGAPRERHRIRNGFAPMRNPGASASLMDDVDFLEALEKFDANPIETERSPSAAIRADPDGEGDWTWETRARFEERRTFDDEPELKPSNAPSVRQTALGVGGFLLMMCLGGAAAALIFHDRVAQILR